MTGDQGIVTTNGVFHTPHFVADSWSFRKWAHFLGLV
jgi:hypothetical protein